jgi:hypothetical protein
MIYDWTAPLRTRDGRDVRLINRLMSGARYSFIVEVDGVWGCCDKHGNLAPHIGSDIVNVPKKQARYLVISHPGDTGGYLASSLEEAKSLMPRHAIVRVEYAEGDCP